MIIVVINGGIGSQLFQYAAAYELAKKTNSTIYLDICFFDFFKTIPNHPHLQGNLYKLDKVIDTSDCRIIKNIWISRLLRVYLKFLDLITFGKINYRRINIKNPFEFKEFSKAKNYFLNGYPNNLSHVEKFMDEFLSKFIPKISSKYEENDRIKVCIHIRKADQADSDCDICDKNYYAKAIQEIYKEKELTSDKVEFLVFCQEEDWPKNNLNLDGAKVSYFIGDHNDAVEDFKLMSNCDHIIMPNSSFSWWAAQKMMAKKNNSMVVCPDLWWDKIDINQINIYPKNWKVISTGVKARHYTPE